MSWRLVRFAEVGSTLDVAHDLAAKGAEAGTVVVAAAQTAGRGRMGRTWRSEPGAGVWMTLIERPRDASSLEVLSLRVGLTLAENLEPLTDAAVQLKWPNDLYVSGGKLAGILIEARWHEGRPDWVAIGVGINLRPQASDLRAAGLRAGTTVDEVLETILPGMRAAAARQGPLDAEELQQFARRDLAAARRCREPVDGVVQGIDATGALLIQVGSQENPRLTAVRAGSLVLEDGF